MRKFISIIYLASISLILSFTACNQDNLRESYDSNLATGYSMYSPTIITDIVTGQNVMKVQVSRTNTNEEATIQITLTASDPEVLDIFSLKSTNLTFPKGVASVDAEILINFDDLGTDQYSMVVSLADPDLVSLGGISSTTVRARLKLEYEDYGKAQFSSEFYEEEWSVNLQKAVGMEYYIISDCYYEGYDIKFSLKDDGTIDTFETQNIGEYYSSDHGYILAQYVSSERVDNKTLEIEIKFVLQSGASFTGTFIETIVFP